MRWRARVVVTLKPGVLDPQGEATRKALNGVGFAGVEDVRVGKFLEVELEAASREAAEEMIGEMSRRLLANPVLEEFRYELGSR
ncbi:MAG TPA: phosphoribosylformylglycinamidine synthase subunit PurS [Bacillota bacterium]|nr:phosphoribosylformylglycinamidine synthase subunit PurS [Bacillota bacterium]